MTATREQRERVELWADRLRNRITADQETATTYDVELYHAFRAVLEDSRELEHVERQLRTQHSRPYVFGPPLEKAPAGSQQKGEER